MINRKVFTGFILSTALLAGSSNTVLAAPTESMSGSVAATSTYIWRGVPQSAGAALQGGIQADLEKNVYVGAWMSNVAANNGSEVDIYGGYKGKADVFDYDAGAILYFYPVEKSGEDLNFIEIYVDVSRDFYGAKLSISSDAGTYLEGYATLPLEHWNLGLHVGRYSIDEDYFGTSFEDYFDFRVSLGKEVGGFDLEFALSDTNLPTSAGDGTYGDFRTTVTVSKGFTP